jgi:hypothetical protein
MLPVTEYVIEKADVSDLIMNMFKAYLSEFNEYL